MTAMMDFKVLYRCIRLRAVLLRGLLNQPSMTKYTLISQVRINVMHDLQQDQIGDIGYPSSC